MPTASEGQKLQRAAVPAKPLSPRRLPSAIRLEKRGVAPAFTAKKTNCMSAMVLAAAK